MMDEQIIMKPSVSARDGRRVKGQRLFSEIVGEVNNIHKGILNTRQYC